MKTHILLIPAILLIGSCSGIPVAVCEPDDTACLESALAASAAAPAAPSVPGETNRDGGDGLPDRVIEPPPPPNGPPIGGSRPPEEPEAL